MTDKISDEAKRLAKCLQIYHGDVLSHLAIQSALTAARNGALEDAEKVDFELGDCVKYSSKSATIKAVIDAYKAAIRAMKVQS